MKYAHAMQESVIHRIAAANSFVYTQSIISLSEVMFKFGEITSQNVYLIQNYEHNQLV